MPEPQVFRNEVWEVGPKYPTARVTDQNGSALVINDVTAITLRVFDLSTNTLTTSIFSTNRTPGSTMFNALQPWDVDGDGFNFQDTVTTNQVLLEGGRTYRLRYIFSTTDGSRPVLFEWRTRSLIGV